MMTSDTNYREKVNISELHESNYTNLNEIQSLQILDKELIV